MKKTIFTLLLCLPAFLLAAELQNVRPMTPHTTYCLAPRWSPDGRLYCSTPKYAEILEINLENGALKPIASGIGCGFRFAFAPDGSIFYKKVTDAGRELWLLGADGQEKRLAVSEATGLPDWYDGAIRVQLPEGVRSWTSAGIETDRSAVGWVYQDGEAIFRVKEDAPPQRLSPPNVESCLPVLSPNAKWLVYETLRSGLFLVNLETGASRSLGDGNNVCWAEDCSFFLFDRTTDDGHRLTAGNVFLMKSDTWEAENLTGGFSLIAVNPTLSPDGKQVAFEADGRIWIGDLVP